MFNLEPCDHKYHWKGSPHTLVSDALFDFMAFPPIIKFISVFILIVFMSLEQNHHHHHRWGQGLNVLEGNNGPFCSVSPPFLFRQVIPPFSSSTRATQNQSWSYRKIFKSEHFHLLVVFWLNYCFLTVVCIIDGGHDRGVGSAEGGRMGVFTVQYHIITLSYYHIICSVKIS